MAGRSFFPSTPVSSTIKTDRHDLTEILLKMVLNTIKQTTKLQPIQALYVDKTFWPFQEILF